MQAGGRGLVWRRGQAARRAARSPAISTPCATRKRTRVGVPVPPASGTGAVCSWVSDVLLIVTITLTAALLVAILVVVGLRRRDPNPSMRMKD